MTGQRYGRLVVLGYAGTRNHREAQWLCKCDCGEKTIVTRSNLKNGNTMSCGCYGRERKSQANKTHGETGTRLYRIWKAMHTRCYNTRAYGYKYYGGRGIRISDEWRDSFESFRDWALANGYRDDLTIDRIDTNGNYEPSNCCWATMAEQNKNKRAPNGYAIKEDI